MQEPHICKAYSVQILDIGHKDMLVVNQPLNTFIGEKIGHDKESV